MTTEVTDHTWVPLDKNECGDPPRGSILRAALVTKSYNRDVKPIPQFEPSGEQVASELVPVTSISGDDEQDTLLLRKMVESAKKYISSFSWCDIVLDSYFGGGVGGIFAVFFFHIRPGRPGIDLWQWVAVGDIPPVYLPLADCKSPADVFRTYMLGMSKWVELARKGQTAAPEQGVPPVNLPATPEWAERINQRLYGLTLAVKPFFDNQDETPQIN